MKELIDTLNPEMKFQKPQFLKAYFAPIPFCPDEVLHGQFEREGIVAFPLLDFSETNDLLGFYHDLPQVAFDGFHTSLFRENYTDRKKIDHKLKAVLGSKLEKLFPGFIPLYGSFMVKEPGVRSSMKIHQDWSYVNEEKSLSFAIWVPLNDVNEKNGPVRFMKSSHRYSLSVRGPGILCPFEKESEWIEENALASFHLKAGEAIAWHHRVLHSSAPNYAHAPRIAVTLIMVPRGEKVIHFFHDPSKPESEIEMFEVDSEFFLTYSIGKRPEGQKLLETFSFSLSSLVLEDIKKILKNNSNIQGKIGILKSINQFFRKSVK